MTKRYQEFLTETMMQLSKEQLVWLLLQWDEAGSLISETMVETSKLHRTPEKALDDIRRCLGKNKAYHFGWYKKPEHIQAELDFFMGKVSRKECRRRLGLEDNND